MLKKSFLMTVICLFMASAIFAQTEKPLSADKVMADSYAKANESGKNVLLIFHASWCSWCKRLDKVMQNDEMKKIFEENFVITHLDVLENEKDKIENFENPGGKELMNKLGGAKSGIPFFAYITAKGETLATSNVMPKNGNIGYPGTLEEINEFMKLLKTGAPKISKEHYKTVLLNLIENSPGLM